MATEFAIWLVGDDEESLMAIGEAALDEVVRVESVLSRFDPAAELARFNRHAAKSHGSLRLSFELYHVLQTLLEWYKKKNGYFDIGWWSAHGEFVENLVALKSDTRSAWSPLGDPQLDLGGFGKGYAFDCAARIVRRFEVTSALLHGGTSSVLAIGAADYNKPWPIGLRDPLARSPELCCGMVYLRNCALSSSADLAKDNSQSADAVSVVTDSAADAEVYSTALLGMGKDLAKDYLEGIENPPRAVAWIVSCEGRATVDWLVGNPNASSH